MYENGDYGVYESMVYQHAAIYLKPNSPILFRVCCISEWLYVLIGAAVTSLPHHSQYDTSHIVQIRSFFACSVSIGLNDRIKSCSWENT
jgi:hypothetical protein